MIRMLRKIWLFIMQKWLIIPIIVGFFVAIALIVPAFSRYGSYVVIAELTCTEDFTGDERQMLAEFLNGCHYGAVGK